MIPCQVKVMDDPNIVCQSVSFSPVLDFMPEFVVAGVLYVLDI